MPPEIIQLAAIVAFATAVLYLIGGIGASIAAVFKMRRIRRALDSTPGLLVQTMFWLALSALFAGVFVYTLYTVVFP